MAAKLFGIDFGTSTIKIYKKNEGVIFDAKNIIAIADKKRVIAIGDEAFEMYGKAPSNIEVNYPVRNGVIANIENMLALLNHAFDQLGKKHGKFTGAEFLVATPTDITEVEKRAFFDLVANSNAKSRKIRIVEKPIADALGAGLNVTKARGVMIVDIGADTTEVSIMSLGGIVLSKLIPIGGNKFDESIILNVKKQYNLYIGHKTAETIKKELACALKGEEKTIKVYGRDVVTGLPMEKEITSSFVYETISEHLLSIIDAMRIILERTPPEISSDIIDLGIYITGGSANIKYLDQLMSHDTDLKINICNDSANTVVNGLGKIIEDPKLSSLALTIKQTYYGV
jgi:rod shape-determining protein MreB